MTITERLRALPPVGQLSLAGAAALVLAIALIGVYLATRPNYNVLFADLRQADAATIVAELEKDKTPYKLDDGGATILAPADQVDQIRLEIMGADLPLKGTVGFELFNKSDMGLTEFAQRINYQRAIQGELARTIMTIDAIDTARVHLTLPEPSIFRAERKPAKASVSLTTRPGHALEQQTVAGIQRLVAASVPDLDAADVVVLDTHGSLATGVPSSAASE
ncbi:MAG TPA: flagellar basal-body MS-ring/collar protein FliF, partial [Brevundimonas sp.]|nr:flagellar basal-body MS-ring/collar protein FliF [Brevundimonas sp.]